MNQGLQFLDREIPSDIVAMRVTGRITVADYEDAMHRLRVSAEQTGKAKLYYEFPAFEGVEPGVFWHKLAHMSEMFALIDRIAVVADQRWMEAWLALAAPLTPMRIRLYPSDQAAEAMRWLRTEAVDMQAHPSGRVAP